MYPVAYDQRPPERRNRLTVLFRALLAIPHFIVGGIYGFVASFTLLIAWVAIVLTGRYPAGLYDFNAGFTRYTSRLVAYYLCVVDDYPPFGIGDHPEYPVRVPIGPPKARYSRAKAFFRIILMIPVAVIAYVMQLWLFAVAIALWFLGVFTGRTSPAITEAMRLPMAYYTRANAYFFLVTEDWPPFDPGRGELVAPPQPVGLPT